MDTETSQERVVIDNKARNELEKSHWNHSKSWGKNFAPEAKETFYHKSNALNFAKDKFFGGQNTLNQIATHYKFGENETNYMTMT